MSAAASTLRDRRAARSTNIVFMRPPRGTDTVSRTGVSQRFPEFRRWCAQPHVRSHSVFCAWNFFRLIGLHMGYEWSIRSSRLGLERSIDLLTRSAESAMGPPPDVTSTGDA